MANLRNFTLRMNKLGNNIELSLNDAIKVLGVRADAEVVLSNPVDTGRSRGNWIVTLNSPTNAKRFEETEGVSGNPFDSDIPLSQAENKLRSRKPGQTVYIQNNTSYIEKLNNGFSAQAPADFVRRGVIAGIQSFKRIKIVDKAARRI